MTVSSAILECHVGEQILLFLVFTQWEGEFDIRGANKKIRSRFFYFGVSHI
jgi:hypothetical protein